MIDWKKFGENLKSATGVSLAGLLIILATNGKQALEVLLGIPALIKAFSAELPLGFWSGVIATVLASSFHLFARSWHKRSFSIEMATIIVGVTVVMVQAHGGTSAQVLSAALVGLTAGFGGLFLSKAARSLFVKGDKADAKSGPDQTLSVPD